MNHEGMGQRADSDQDPQNDAPIDEEMPLGSDEGKLRAAEREIADLKRQLEPYQKALLEEKIRVAASMMKPESVPTAYAEKDEPLAPCESFDLLAEVSNMLTEMRHRLAPVLMETSALPADEKPAPAGPLVSGLRELVRQARTVLIEISI